MSFARDGRGDNKEVAMLIRIEPGGLRVNDTLSKQERRERRRRQRPKEKKEEPKVPRLEEVTLDLVA